MTPIAIVTRNRHCFLDVTLRSLSAARLPADQILLVFDDGSDHPITLDYLYSDKVVPLAARWPVHNQHWKRLLGDVKSKQRGAGLAGKIRVVRLNKKPQGVVRASCRTFCAMIKKYGKERGILIVQDDVVFNEDWFERLQDAERKPERDTRPVGLIGGCWINRKNPTKRSPMTLAEHGGMTAQCYYVTPTGIDAVWPWVSKDHHISKGFDNKFCAAVRQKADVYRMHPAVCQHIGITSMVRPKWTWYQWTSKGRIDFSACGPYPLAKQVPSFRE